MSMIEKIKSWWERRKQRKQMLRPIPLGDVLVLTKPYAKSTTVRYVSGETTKGMSLDPLIKHGGYKGKILFIPDNINE